MSDMVNFRDAALFLVFLIGGLGVFIGVGGLQLAGSSGNAACNIPVVEGLFSQCNTEVTEKYDLRTEITIQATDANAVFNEQSFQYSTEKSSIYDGLSFLGPQSNLAFGGANDVSLNFQLFNSDGELVADGNKYIGELGVFQSESSVFTVDNLPTGDYTVRYGLSYTQDLGIVEGSEYDKTLEKNIRVPKRIN